MFLFSISSLSDPKRGGRGKTSHPNYPLLDPPLVVIILVMYSRRVMGS